MDYSKAYKEIKLKYGVIEHETVKNNYEKIKDQYDKDFLYNKSNYIAFVKAKKEVHHFLNQTLLLFSLQNESWNKNELHTMLKWADMVANAKKMHGYEHKNQISSFFRFRKILRFHCTLLNHIEKSNIQDNELFLFKQTINLSLLINLDYS
jgi:hypothetical protein